MAKKKSKGGGGEAPPEAKVPLWLTIALAVVGGAGGLGWWQYADLRDSTVAKGKFEAVKERLEVLSAAHQELISVLAAPGTGDPEAAAKIKEANSRQAERLNALMAEIEGRDPGDARIQELKRELERVTAREKAALKQLETATRIVIESGEVVIGSRG
jgi:hypothetical protein